MYLLEMLLRCINAVGCVKKRHTPRSIHKMQAILSVCRCSVSDIRATVFLRWTCIYLSLIYKPWLSPTLYRAVPPERHLHGTNPSHKTFAIFLNKCKNNINEKPVHVLTYYLILLRSTWLHLEVRLAATLGAPFGNHSSMQRFQLSFS